MSWKKVKLGTVLKQYRIEHWVQNDKIYKQVSILNDGSVVLRGEKIGKEIGRKRQFIIDLIEYPNTLIFTRQLLLQGSIGMASKEVNGCIVTENMPMFSITGIQPEFLFIFLKSELFKSQVRNLKTSGTAQKSLHERQFLELEIPLPTLSKQIRIVEEFKEKQQKLSVINNEIEAQQTYLQLLRQTILQEAVQGKLTKQNSKDEPATELLKRIKAEKQKLIKAGKLKKEKELPLITEDEIPFELPEGWVWCRLGEVAYKITDGFHNTPPRVKEGIPYVLATQIKSEGIDFENCSYVSPKDHKELWTKAFPQKGEILLVNIGAGCGTPAIIDVDFEFSFKNSAIIKQPKEIDTDFLFNYLLSIQEKVYNEVIQGGAQPFLSLRMINNLLFPLPPLDEQQRIVAKVRQLQQHLIQLEAQVQQSHQYAQQLLQSVLREAFEEKGKVYEMGEEKASLVAEE
jgi:type I restriction enzyme, S subunit